MNGEVTLRAYVLQRLHARFRALLLAVSVISCGLYLIANHRSNRHQLLNSLEVSKQVLLQAFDAGDPSLTVAYLKSTIEQGNFYRVEVRDKATGAPLFGPLVSSSRRYIDTCSTTDLGSRFGAELVACRRVVGIPEIAACALFVLTIALVAALGIRFIRRELSDWSDGLSGTLDRLSALGATDGSALPGVSPVREVADLHRRIVRILADSRKVIELEASAKIAAQVAHDIQSPLAALEGAAREVGASDGGRGLMMSALARIRGISDDLRRREGGGALEALETTSVDLNTLLREIIAEKKAQYRTMKGVSIDLAARLPAGEAVVADVKELGRIVSNLVNNSVEAMAGAHGRVVIEAAASDEMVEIQITDDGTGIPSDILPQLAQEGATFGKTGGVGLGLFHARKTVEAWGGRLEIGKAPDRGTVVRVFIPLAARNAAETVLIDDDPLVRANWSMAARRAGRTFRSYSDAGDFLRDLDSGIASKSCEVFVDCELADGARGEDAAREIHGRGCIDISLATGHSPESLPAMSWVRKIVGKSPPW